MKSKLSFKRVIIFILILGVAVLSSGFTQWEDVVGAETSQVDSRVDLSNPSKPDKAELIKNQGEVSMDIRDKSSDPSRGVQEYTITAKKDIAVIKDGRTGPHTVELERAVEYRNGSKTGSWHLKQGESLNFRVEIKADFGQGFVMGYILNGKGYHVNTGSMIFDSVITVTALQDGEYTFFIYCASSDPLQVQLVDVY